MIDTYTQEENMIRFLQGPSTRPQSQNHPRLQDAFPDARGAQGCRGTMPAAGVPIEPCLPIDRFTLTLLITLPPRLNPDRNSELLGYLRGGASTRTITYRSSQESRRASRKATMSVARAVELAPRSFLVGIPSTTSYVP